MRHATLVLNRQLIRLGKGILKAWEQWVDDIERELLAPNLKLKPELHKLKDGEKVNQIVNS